MIPPATIMGRAMMVGIIEAPRPWLPRMTNASVIAVPTCAVVLLCGASAAASEADVDDATEWVRALARHDTDRIISSTRLPFVFRTPGRDRSCQGWIRTKKALSAWVACVAKRQDVRTLRGLLEAEAVDVRSSRASSGEPKADDLTIELGGPAHWSEWRQVSVTHLWTTILIRVRDRSAGGRFSVGAMIMDMKSSHD